MVFLTPNKVWKKRNISEPPRSLFLAQDSIWVIAVVLCEDLVSTKNSDQSPGFAKEGKGVQCVKDKYKNTKYAVTEHKKHKVQNHLLYHEPNGE